MKGFDLVVYVGMRLPSVTTVRGDLGMLTFVVKERWRGVKGEKGVGWRGWGERWE